MRAIIKASAAPGLTVTDVPEPECGANDVLIRVHHAGVCGTDVHISEWDEWAQGRIRPPVVVGHEFAGEIVELGAGVGLRWVTPVGYVRLDLAQPLTESDRGLRLHFTIGPDF